MTDEAPAPNPISTTDVKTGRRKLIKCLLTTRDMTPISGVKVEFNVVVADSNNIFHIPFGSTITDTLGNAYIPYPPKDRLPDKGENFFIEAVFKGDETYQESTQYIAGETILSILAGEKYDYDPMTFESLGEDTGIIEEDW
jgi:hypothetical protein